MKLAMIRRRWLRRTVMVLVFPLVTLQYIYLGLRNLCVEARWCWSLPDTPQYVHEGQA